MDEFIIQYQMYAELMRRGHRMVAPNVSWSWLYWEADLISVTQADYWHEYEIKCTKSDFIRDFDKAKHRMLQGALSHYERIPNYFWYVAPITAIPLCIPDYAGLIQVNWKRHSQALEVKYVKKAKLLHHNKLSSEGYTAMLRSVMFKYWDMVKINADILRNQEEKRNYSQV